MGDQQGSLNRQDLMEIPGHPGYFVDANGCIISLKRAKEKTITPCNHKARGGKTYCRVKVGGGSHLAHRLIASAKTGRRLLPGEVVNHINGDTKDNHPSNLEVVSHRDNVKHAVENALYCSGEDWYKARGMLKS